MLILLVSSASGFIWLNFDGSTEGNLGLVGVGGLLLDSAGSSILPFSSSLGLCSVNRGDGSFADWPLSTLHLNLRTILVESDSTCAISWT